MKIIKDWRKRANLKQSELAKQLGVSQNLVSAWECGRYRPSAVAARNLHALSGGELDKALIRPDVYGPD